MTRRNGRTAGRFDLAPDASALLHALLGPLAKPRPSSDTGPDPRTTAERNGDALAEILNLAADSGTAPTEAGERPHLTVTINLRDLQAGLGHAVLGDSDLDAASARRIACDSRVIPAVLGTNS
ncbi:MAG TPA: DUF222 domain-containing protein, partial [Pseudonocardiaceae bacterium]|nr:DUF222 domain-containing protein [Pseudonocardiaceae bacterium]